MPIEIDGEVWRMSEDEFLRVAYAVTGAAFALHKEYGVMFSERLYKLELAAECQKLGFDPISVELPIHVLWGDFRKDYFVDLLVAGGALFELKVLAELVEAPSDELTIVDGGEEIATVTRKPRRTWPCQPGSAKDTEHWMAPDFDAPLDDFREYME